MKLIKGTFLLLFVIFFSFRAPDQVDGMSHFNDVDVNHWAYQTIQWGIKSGVINGFDDNTFRPNQFVTEEQFVSILVRAFGDILDDPQSTLWSDKYYFYLTSKNYPLSNNRSQKLTRARMAEIVSSTQGVNFHGKYAIKYLLDRGLANGKTSSTVEGFEGYSYLTRAEALQMIGNLLIKNPNAILLDRPIQPTNAATLNVKVLPVEELETIGNAEQVILVTAQDYKQATVEIQTFEKINGIWKEKFSKKNGVIGQYGFTENMKEGSRKSPEGVFALTKAFGKLNNPETKLPYIKVDKNDYWVDDVSSKYYNTWQRGSAYGRWESAESLLRKDDLYDLAVIIDYNTAQISGKGSAIFLHIWPSAKKSTAGCTAMAKPDLVEILSWLDPDKKPVIVQSVEKNLTRY